MNDLEGHSRSPELPLFDRPHITSCCWSVVTTTRKLAPFTRYYHMLFYRVGYMTACELEKSFISKRYRKLQVTSTFRFIRKHIIHNACYISEIRELERFQTAKVTFKVIEGHLQWCHSIGHVRFPIILPSHLAPFSRYYHLFPKI